jgi:glutamate synthase domain-containing protein 3
MIERHNALTGDERADEIYNNWGTEKDKFWQVHPSESKSPVVHPVED